MRQPAEAGGKRHRNEEKMRKKSHISLAQYLVNTLNDEELRKHRFSFYLGSILPDIKPSFVYKRHEMTGTYSSIQQHIKRLSEGDKLVHRERTGRKYYMDLGQISHYLADYFTFPHNKIYPGNLKDHCSYEEQLKNDLKQYIESGEAAKQRLQEKSFENAEKICDYIKRFHEEYILRKHDVRDDIEHIFTVNQYAVKAMMQLLAERRAEYFLEHS